MYQYRFNESLSAELTLQQIRGKEGVRVRESYLALAKEFGVQWNGRNYDRSSWENSDAINKALSAANAVLYSIVLAGLHSLGYSPSLGFIHTGKQLSFVYDIADLVKTQTSMPAAFEAAANGDTNVETRARAILRDRCSHERIQDRLTTAIPKLFNSSSPLGEESSQDIVSSIWDPNGPIAGGIQYGHDDC